MTRDHARKKAVRARMSASGEPYSTAARKLSAGQEAAREAAADVVARVDSTLAASWARMKIRVDWGGSFGREQRLGPVERLAAFGARAVGKRIATGTYLGNVRDKLKQAVLHPEGEGFIEPGANRYQLNFGGFAVTRLDGSRYRGPAGAPLQGRPPSQPDQDDPLELLRKLRDATDARPAGRDTVRGTSCRVIAVRAGSAEFTVWIDSEHIRRVQTKAIGSSDRGSLSITKTLELWDFGARDVPADWTHLPDFPTAVPGTTPGR